MNTYLVAQVRFKLLDSLRGIAALAVTLFHFHGLFKIFPTYSFPLLLDYPLSKGALGVQIFFVLSGFVIAYSIRNANFTLKFLAEFFIKRSIRLDPPYWAVLFLTISATLTYTMFTHTKNPFSSSQIFANIFYLQGVLDFVFINPVAWTLCIELQLYMFLVVILSLFFHFANTHPHKSSTFSINFTLFFSLLLLLSLENNFHLFFSSDHHMASYFIPFWYNFFIGCAICWNLIKWISRGSLYTYFGIITLYSIYSMNIEIWVTLIIAILIYLMGRLDRLSTFIISPVFQYLGKISFSLYLIHWLVGSNCIHFLCKRVGILNDFKVGGIFIFSLITTIVASHLFYLYVELPCLNLSKKYKKGFASIYFKKAIKD
jgi:peptidoglycan/LPS O-acetylase OafA/YrhL